MKQGYNKLSINNSLQDTYSCLWNYKWYHLIISLFAFLPFTLTGYLGFFDPFYLPRTSHEIVPAGYNLSLCYFILTTLLWTVPCLVFWYRLYLLGPENLLRWKIWPILTRSFIIVTNFLFLLGLFSLLTIAFLTILAFIVNYQSLNNIISNFIELTDYELLRYIVIISITGMITYLAFLRFSLAICARTIGKRIGFITSWRLTKKNTFKMFLSFVGVFMPILGLTFGILNIYGIIMEFYVLSSEKFLNSNFYIHTFILAPVFTLPISAVCSQCAVFYRHCGGENYTQDN